MIKARELSFQYDTDIYPLDAIRAAAYTFTDRLTVRIDRKGKGPVSVRLTPKAGTADLGALSGEFENELLHETLRLKVSQANQKIREYIVTKALVSAQIPSSLPPAVAAAPAAASDACPECDKTKENEVQPGAPQPVDAELEKEIEKLLAEIEKGGAAEDPLGVAVAWEDKYGAKTEKGESAATDRAAKIKRVKTPPAKAEASSEDDK